MYKVLKSYWKRSFIPKPVIKLRSQGNCRMVLMWQSLQLEAVGEREARGRSSSVGLLLPLCSLDAFGISCFSFFLQ